jgi:erythromycin esterase-like protein
MITNAIHQSQGRLASLVQPLRGDSRDLDPLLNAIGEARYVLIGESTHGTHEFYHLRAELTKRLILEKGFRAVTIEGDWPDSDRINHFVRHLSADTSALQALSGFKRFPSWMWRNTDVVDFVNWLRAHNEKFSEQNQKVGFYGLDLYSLHASAEAVIAYLDKVDPAAAQRARHRYGCF